MTASQKLCFIKDTGIFSRLDNNFINFIAQKSKVLNLVKKRGGNSEFPINNKIYIIHDGIVFLSCIDKDGKKIILNILSSGSVFGDLNFNEKEADSNDCLYIEPLGEAKICEMEKSDFEQVLIENPKFAVSILSDMSARFVTLEQKMGIIVFSDVEARLISQLIKLSEKYGNFDDNKLNVGIRLTHEKLSEMIGSARETASEAISNLDNKGIISKNSDGIYVLDRKRLQELFS